MTTLSKEDVISSLQAALEKQSGTAVNIEQSGSWYKIDGGKSVRFSELESMLAEMGNGSQTVAKTATKPAAKKAAVTKTKSVATKKSASAPVKSAQTGKGSGLTPKELWRAKLENAKGKNTLPRGF